MIARMMCRIALGLIIGAVTAPGLYAMQQINGVNCDGGACPRPLELVDGRSVTIGLAGRGLDALTSGVVTDGSGHRIEGVTVELGAPSRPGRRRTATMTRDVTVTAEGIAAALTGLELRFTTRLRRRVTAPLELSTAPMPTGAVVAGPTVPLADPPLRQPGSQTPTTIEEAIAAATPSVTGADQTLVKLKADGATQQVVLQGSSLDRVTGAHVQQEGRKIPGMRAEVLPGANPTRRSVRLSAGVSAGVPWDQPLDLVVEAPGRMGVTVAYPTPVKVSALGTLRPDHDIFARAINNAGVLSDVSVSVNSCGSVDGARRFSIALPKLPYSVSGPVPRLEQNTTNSQRVEFLEEHSTNPTPLSGAQQVISAKAFNAEELGNTAHPSAIRHTVSAVRMCVANLSAQPSWKVTGAGETGGVPHLIITAGFADARFRVRGMPMEPTTGATGLDVGILWGHEITDKELPDRLYDSPKYDVRLPMEVANGQLRFGSPTVNFAAAPRWSAAFLGPSSVRSSLEKFAGDRIQQIQTEITKAFNAAKTRNKLASVTWPILESVGVTEMLGIEKASDGTSRFVYR